MWAPIRTCGPRSSSARSIRPTDSRCSFYREPKAPDMNLRADELDLDAIRAARIFWTTGTGLSDEPSRTATLGALDVRDRSGITIHDLDYRPMFWKHPDEASQWQRRALERVTIAIGNLEECAVAVGEGSPSEMAKRILDLGVEVAVVKMGPAGVTAFTRGSEVSAAPVRDRSGQRSRGRRCLRRGGLPRLCSRAGAGRRRLPFANAAGAYVAGQLACADAMPTEAASTEVDG